jgi:hypothetical protein
MTIEIASVLCGGPGLQTPSGLFEEFDNRDNRLTPCQAYQQLLDRSRGDIQVLCHDDVTIHDPEWLARIESIFVGRPDCVAVGLGGATRLGSRDLGRKPWDIWQMARSGYASNQTDAEVHGERFTGDRRVAVLDAFILAVRVSWLRARNGWPVAHLTHHCLDTWLACEAARDRKEIWMTGASCTHHGGGSSTKPEYAQAKWLQGGSLESDHQSPHRWLAREYADCLPITL